jgi:hypothetical protein
LAESSGATSDAMFPSTAAVWMPDEVHRVGVEELLGDFDEDAQKTLSRADVLTCRLDPEADMGRRQSPDRSQSKGLKPL